MSSNARRNGQAGVTLLETLVVLVVVAVLAGTMLQSASSVAARQDVEDLTALAARLTTLSDIALASGATIQLSVDSTPWNVSAGMDEQGAVRAFDWLQNTNADTYDVRNGNGEPVSVVVFSPSPLPQTTIFDLRVAQIDGVSVMYDGLSAEVVSDASDD